MIQSLVEHILRAENGTKDNWPRTIQLSFNNPAWAYFDNKLYIWLGWKLVIV